MHCTVRVFLFLIDHNQKLGAVNQMVRLCFHKRSTDDQLNVQAATAESEK